MPIMIWERDCISAPDKQIIPVRSLSVDMTMARGAAFVSLEPYKLTGVQLTGRELGIGSSATAIELEYMGLKCAGKKIHEALLKCGGSDYIDATRQFSKECHFLSRINHPIIVQFLGVYFQPEINMPILVMEFLPTNLTSCIERHGIFPNEVKYSILHDIAQGLLYLHCQAPPIIHRDLSSNNVLLTPILTAKIADLGVARILSMSPVQVSRMTQNPGTLIYMPPEVMVADPHYNTSIDVSSYGILMIQIFCGQSPAPHVAPTRYEAGRLVAVSEAERRQKFLQAMENDHPLLNLTLKCINNDPDLRPTAKEIVNELEKKASIIHPSFKQRLDTLRYVAVSEAEKRMVKRKDKVEVVRKKVIKSTVQVPTKYMWIAIVVAFISIFLAYNAGVQIERNEKKPKQLTPSKVHVHTERDSDFRRLAHNFVNTIFGECTVGETIACDRVIPAVLRDFSHILWTSGQSLQTSVYQGRTVIIDDRIYYGGGIADESHEYIVYCYNLQLDNWTTLEPLPIKSFGLGKFDGKLIALGGMTHQNEENTKVYTFDEISNSWTTGASPNTQISRVYPEVLNLPSALVVAGGQSIEYYTDYKGYYWRRSIEVYTKETGWYWSDQPLPDSSTDLTLTVAGNNCFVLGGNYSKALVYLQWISHKSPLSLHVSIENILWDRNKTVPGRAYEYREKLIYPSYRWRELPGGRSNQANSLVATVLAGNLITLGIQGQKDNLLRMYSFTNESWTQIGRLPDKLEGATMTALSSIELLVTGHKESGLLSVYRGSVQITQTISIPPGPISSNLFRAIKLVESNGNINAVGDGGNAIGPFQISKQYWKIAKDFDPSLTANRETYQNCKGPGSELYSMRIMQASHSM